MIETNQKNLSVNIMSKLYNLGCSFARGNIADKCNHLCETHLGPGKLIADYLNFEEVF